jgi:pimeloyl-ACP methyl ester carboxylesterase
MTRADAGPPIVWAGDAAFSYLDAGSGQALVLLHGIGSATASFQYQVETLSPRFRVIAWDAPGYGASTRLATERPDASQYVAALDRWLGALRIDRCHMLGHSLGTLIAARFAAEQPKRHCQVNGLWVAFGVPLCRAGGNRLGRLRTNPRPRRTTPTPPA